MTIYLILTYLIGLGMQSTDTKQMNWWLWLISPVMVPVFIGAILNDFHSYLNKKAESKNESQKEQTPKA